jgi:hypothetical protein
MLTKEYLYMLKTCNWVICFYYITDSLPYFYLDMTDTMERDPLMLWEELQRDVDAYRPFLAHPTAEAPIRANIVNSTTASSTKGRGKNRRAPIQKKKTRIVGAPALALLQGLRPSPACPRGPRRGSCGRGGWWCRCEYELEAGERPPRTRREEQEPISFSSPCSTSARPAARARSGHVLEEKEQETVLVATLQEFRLIPSDGQGMDQVDLHPYAVLPITSEVLVPIQCG